MVDDDAKYPSDLADRFQLRLPPGLRDRIKHYATLNGRSMNTEIVHTLNASYPEEPKPEDYLDALEKAVEMLRSHPTRDLNFISKIALAELVTAVRTNSLLEPEGSTHGSRARKTKSKPRP